MKCSFLKTCIYSLGLAIGLVSFAACDGFGLRATGDYVTQTFDETGFNGLDLGVNASAELRIDSVFKVEITCEESVMPYLETNVSGGVLYVRFSRNVYDLDDMKVVVSAPSWEYFDLSGSGRILVLDPIAGNLLRADVSGSGNIEILDASFDSADLEVSGSGGINCRAATFDHSKLEVSGSGDIELRGSGDDLRCEVSGSGNVDCLDFPVNAAYLKITGSGNIKVDVDELLDVDISGSGDVLYRGNAQVNAHVSGSGGVKKY